MAREPLSPEAPVSFERLGPSDAPDFARHLLSLSPRARRSRFNGTVSDAFLAAYAGRTLASGAAVLCCRIGGRVACAGELHPLGEDTWEAGLSVADAHRGKGFGGRLFEAMLGEARSLGAERVVVVTSADNEAMKAVARRAGAAVVTRSGECRCVVLVPGASGGAGGLRTGGDPQDFRRSA